MSKNRVIGKIAGEQPHKLSDKSARLWESYHGPMNGAAQALNAAIANVQNILGRVILTQEGFDPDTHLFNADNLTIVRRPVPPGENGA
jgi:hypothetical protein